MVHTAELLISLNEDDTEKLAERNLLVNGLTQNDLSMSYPGITFKLYRDARLAVVTNAYTIWFVQLNINFLKMIGKTNIELQDIPKIINRLSDFLPAITCARLDEIRLRRIDYCFNDVIEDEKTRDVLYKLLKKSFDKKCYMLKNTVSDEAKKKKGKSEDSEEANESLYYNSKSKAVIIYDKPKERNARGYKIEPYESDVLRYEARVLSKHIYYQYKNNGTSRTLESYLCEELYKKYMNEMVIETFFSGDYYNEYNAKKKILASKNIKERDKDDIISFQIDISKSRSLTKAIKAIGEYKGKRFLEILQNENINPILIPKNDKLTFIKNPLASLYDT